MAALVIAMIAGMCAAIVLTNGRAIASERAVIATIDGAGTRSITITARSGKSFDSGLVDRVLAFSNIEWVGATQFVADAANAHVPGGNTAPVRRLWASTWDTTGLPEPRGEPGTDVYATKVTLTGLGFADGVGQIQARSGSAWFIAGPTGLPSHLASFGTSVLVLERSRSHAERFDQVIVLTRSTDHIDTTAKALTTLVDLDDPADYTVSTSQQLAEVRTAVKGQLSVFGRTLAAGIVAITATLACAVLVLSVMQRRRDFGRRRALGASRSLIVLLVVTQTVMLSAIGAVAGVGVAAAILAATDAPTPPIDYLGAVAVLALLISLIAAILPAMIASRRDPVRELRVP
ncbi:FtsX-like permease family protein [Leifsonia sp. NPDC058248]|uniref:FtsX-like permease family protein n=1 Tax=Leifsonia sp. NPDC058248 TaxID=3346402 RepID=UPI0036DE9491